MKLFKSIKAQLIIFLSCFAVFLAIKDKDAAFLAAVLIAVVSAVVFESAVRWIKERALTLSGSSIISGLIIGYVLSSDNHRWVIIITSLFAILSKHLIRLNKKHIFNPAAFGIFFVTIFLGATTQWKGTYAWYIVAFFGIYFILKTRKIELLISYFLISFILFGIQAFLQRTPLVNIFGYLSYFYIFIMMIEPKTTPINLFGKIVFGTGVGVSIFILSAAGVKFDAELSSLLIMNMSVPLLNKLR